MFRLLHQCNDIVEKKQLTNDQRPEFYCQCKCSKCPPPAPSTNTSFTYFYKSFTALSIGPCGRLPQITWSASLTLAIVFSFVLAWSRPPTLHPARDNPLGLYLANSEATGLLWWNLDSWPTARSLRCVCWRAVLLEDELGGQPALALKEW